MGLHPWLSRGLLAAIQLNSFKDVLYLIRIGVVPFRKTTLEERRDCSILSDARGSLKCEHGRRECVVAGGQKNHPVGLLKGILKV